MSSSVLFVRDITPLSWVEYRNYGYAKTNRESNLTLMHFPLRTLCLHFPLSRHFTIFYQAYKNTSIMHAQMHALIYLPLRRTQTIEFIVLFCLSCVDIFVS